MTKSRPVLIIFSVLAGLQVMTNGASLGDILGAKILAFLGLCVAAVQIGMGFYVQNLTLPIKDVAAYVTSGESPATVAGPASAVTNGTEVTVEEAPAQAPPEAAP